MMVKILSRNLFFLKIMAVLALIIFLLTASPAQIKVGASNQNLLTTCPVISCPVPRVYAFQPARSDMRNTFYQASANLLSSNGPSYKLINYENTQTNVSPDLSIPQVILRGISWQESRWLQFADTFSGYDNTNACTLVAVASVCGYGAMQITQSCMADNSCGWFDPNRVSAELPYNIGVGTNILIDSWNITPTIGDNNYTSPENWYFAVIFYNYWSSCNDPNRSTPNPNCIPNTDPYNSQRPPYGEANFQSFNYPYQEKVWGTIAHPELSLPATQILWRPTRIPAIPDGIFGLREQNDWRPPISTPIPETTILRNLNVANGTGPTIVLHNTTGQSLAADVALYNSDNSFSRWWLGSVPPNYSYSFIRLNANETRSLPLSQVFAPGENFSGYSRVVASHGVEVSMTYSQTQKLFLPIIKNEIGNCFQEIYNGGFEDNLDGKPLYWVDISSADNFLIRDSTWFKSGHYGAYLAGYNNANDKTSQYISIPTNATNVALTFDWFIYSEETLASDYDYFYFRFKDSSKNLVYEIGNLTNRSIRDSWQTSTFDLSSVGFSNIRYFSFDATNDFSQPTSFYVDNVSLKYCTP